MSVRVHLSLAARLMTALAASLPSSALADGALRTIDAFSASADGHLIAQEKPTQLPGQFGLSGSIVQPGPVTGFTVMLAQEAHLHGVWRADIASMLSAEAAHLAPEELAMMQSLMGNVVIDFEFRPDGSASMSMSGMGQAETKDGEWRLVSVDGASIRFVLTETSSLGEAPAPEYFTARFNSTNNLILTKDGDPQVIPFFRL